MEKLLAQNDLMIIARELERLGYTVNVIETIQGGCVQYVFFYKSEDEIFGIESSDTFKLDDEVLNLHEPYFHVGHFTKSHGYGRDKSKNRYSLWFFTVETSAKNVIKNLEKNIAYGNSTLHGSDMRIKDEYEKWKLKRRCVKGGG